MTHGSPGRRAFSGHLIRAINRYDPNGSEAHRIRESIADPNNPNRPEHNQNPLEIEAGDVIVIKHLFDHTLKKAFEVLSVKRGWNHKIHLGLGNTGDGVNDLGRRVLLTHLTVESNGVNAIQEVLAPSYRAGHRGITATVIVDRVLLGEQAEA